MVQPLTAMKLYAMGAISWDWYLHLLDYSPEQIEQINDARAGM